MTLAGYTHLMSHPQNIAEATLVGWRKTVADRVAPHAASRAPVSEEHVRAAFGGALFLLSVYYVGSSIARMIRSTRN